MDKYRKHQIEVLEQAFDLCKEGGCESALPYIKLRINWLKQNCNFYE